MRFVGTKQEMLEHLSGLQAMHRDAARGASKGVTAKQEGIADGIGSAMWVLENWTEEQPAGIGNGQPEHPVGLRDDLPG